MISRHYINVRPIRKVNFIRRQINQVAHSLEKVSKFYANHHDFN